MKTSATCCWSPVAAPALVLNRWLRRISHSRRLSKLLKGLIYIICEINTAINQSFNLEIVYETKLFALLKPLARFL